MPLTLLFIVVRLQGQHDDVVQQQKNFFQKNYIRNPEPTLMGASEDERHMANLASHPQKSTRKTVTTKP